MKTKDQIELTSAVAATSSSTSVTTPAFWERLWRTSGLQFVVFLIIAYVIRTERLRWRF